MDNLRRLGSQMSVQIPTDEKGLTGRQCPGCSSFFKIEFGTGLSEEDLPCYCPYCGHKADHSEFFTSEQIEYAKSVAVRSITDAVFKDFKKLEFNHKPKGAFGIGLSLKVQRSRVPAIKYYQEETLETEIVCANCTLHYSVFGVFAYCPDCATHNSFQVLDQNFALLEKQVALAEREGGELGRQLIEDALENAVSVFDAFGRETCKLISEGDSTLINLQGISFQNLEAAYKKVLKLLSIDLKEQLEDGEWDKLLVCFQKRHLLTHTLGVVDLAYINKSGDRSARVGTRVQVSILEVRTLVDILRKVSRVLWRALND